jgi:hypothetical protein
MRAVLAIVGGLVAGAAAMMALALIGGMLFPASGALDPYRPQQIMDAFENLSTGGKAAILLSWFGGALVGAWVAKLIVRQSWSAWTIAGLFALYVLASVLVLPMPVWMEVVAVVLPLVGGFLANHLVASLAPAEGEAEADAAPPPADI